MSNCQSVGNTKYLGKIVNISFIVYLIFLLYYYIIKNSIALDFEVYCLQLFLAFQYFFIIRYSISNKKIPFLLIFISLCVDIFIINNYFFNSFGSYFGPDANDSERYYQYGMKSAQMDLEGAFRFYKNSGGVMTWDDYGMCLISRFCCILGGNRIGYLFYLGLFNSISITVSTFIFSKIVCIFEGKNYSSCIAIIYAIFTPFIMFAPWGLKENFFIINAIAAIFYAFKFIDSHRLWYLILFFFFCFMLSLFRLAVCAQYILSFAVCFFIKFFKNKFIFFLVVSVMSVMLFQYIDDIMISLGGGTLETAISNAQYYSGSDNLMVIGASQILYSVLGIPPRFNGEIDFTHFCTYAWVLRSFLSIYLVVGILNTIKYMTPKSIFLLFVYISGVLQLVITFRGFDFRYGCLYFPSIILLSLQGFINREKSLVPLKFIATSVLLIAFVSMILWND